MTDSDVKRKELASPPEGGDVAAASATAEASAVAAAEACFSVVLAIVALLGKNDVLAGFCEVKVS